MTDRDELDREQQYLLYAIRYWCAGRPTCDVRILQHVAELLAAIGANDAVAPFSAMMNAVGTRANCKFTRRAASVSATTNARSWR
jgi:hypothetical protein